MSWSTNAIFLYEREHGFHPTKLGFPSIEACRAVVLHTTNGLFGVHQASGPDPTKFDNFGDRLNDFYTGHASRGGAMLGMYVASFLGAKTGYSKIEDHRGEMQAYARKLTYTGKIKSYDLSAKFPDSSAYVEFEVVSGTVVMHAKAWNTEIHKPYRIAFDPQFRDDLKTCPNPAKNEFKSPGLMLTQADTAGWVKIEPIPIN